MSIQSQLDKLKSHFIYDYPYWDGKPNEWIRRLPASETGDVGERLAIAVLGGTQAPNNKRGYDIELDNGEWIEVKTSTVMVDSRDYPYLVWRQIRPDDPWDSICFIAIYPDDVRMFLVPKNYIPMGQLDKKGQFQINTRRVHDFDGDIEWMRNWEE